MPSTRTRSNRCVATSIASGTRRSQPQETGRTGRKGVTMTTITESHADVPVRKSVTVNASAERAFRIFTEEMDTWWPRTHHIGKVPMRKQLIEPRAGGRCYSEQIDGTECPWGT